LDLIGSLLDSITIAETKIDAGRKGFAIRGKADEGRISYETGVSQAMAAFQEAQTSADPQAILLSEYAFLLQEHSFCNAADTDSLSSLTKALKEFDDAFLALGAVEDKTLYQGADITYPHDDKHRVKGYPKDSFHLACDSHRTRLQNVLRAPGIDLIEKALLKQRLANLSTARSSYIGKQKNALGELNPI
jgi:hypothetical protein